MSTKDAVKVYFSDFFDVPYEEVEAYGAFDVSLINDLPLFVDPFLLFNSEKPEYKALHDSMIYYLRFLRDVSIEERVNDGLLLSWFMFSEVKQNWLGFSIAGNKGSGLGIDFARVLNRNLYKIFSDFGSEKVTKGSHLEKLCLIGSGIGRDNISDFTTNLIKEYLLNYTQSFALEHLSKKQRRIVKVPKVHFNYGTQTWQPGEFELPYVLNDYVILTPSEMLTREDIWINRNDMVRDYRRILNSVSNDQLRAQLNNYLYNVLHSLPLLKKPTQKDKDEAVLAAYREFPELLDYYIRFKEDNGDKAVEQSDKFVSESKQFYIKQINDFVEELNKITGFYKIIGTTYDEARARVLFLKDVIENKGGHRIFYDAAGKPIRKESDVQILYRLTWFGTPSDISREVNDGRGPVDYKASRGAFDKTLVEFKLASNSQLEKNLQHQVDIYQKASDAPKAIKVIFYFSGQELNKVYSILKRLQLTDSKDIILIDARKDNKPSGSKAKTNQEVDFPDLNVDFGDIDLSDLKFDENVNFGDIDLNNWNLDNIDFNFDDPEKPNK